MAEDREDISQLNPVPLTLALKLVPPCADAEAVAQASKAKATRGWRGRVNPDIRSDDGVRSCHI